MNLNIDVNIILMKRFSSIILLLLFKVLCISSSKTQGKLPGDIPNPNTHPELCGRSTVPRSFICDPELILLDENKNVIEGFINSIERFQVAVLIINKMHENHIKMNTIEKCKRYQRCLRIFNKLTLFL